MEAEGMKRNGAGAGPLTAQEALDRLFQMMAAWWEGWSLGAIARQHGVSRQRVGALLAGVGCTEEVRRKVRRDLPARGRRAAVDRVADARRALLHPLAWRLTVRQRSALAWQAQGLVLLDIARRMGITCQGAQGHLMGARARLERMEAAAARKATKFPRPRLPKPLEGPAAEPPDIGAIDLTGALEELIAEARKANA